MSKRIDHATEASSWIDNAISAQSSEEPEALAVAYAGIAQAHATLALVEQQRIANLIALGQFRVGVNDLPHLRHLAVVPAGMYDLQPVAEIREGLGLS